MMSQCLVTSAKRAYLRKPYRSLKPKFPSLHVVGDYLPIRQSGLPALEWCSMPPALRHEKTTT